MTRNDRKTKAARRAVIRRVAAEQKVRACACGAKFTPRRLGLLLPSQCPECWPKAVAKHRERHEAGLAVMCVRAMCPLEGGAA